MVCATTRRDRNGGFAESALRTNEECDDEGVTA
jgi:hypothetical protein